MKGNRSLRLSFAALAFPALASATAAAPQASLSFSDQTAASGLIASYQNSGFLHDIELAGLAAGDFDNDGWQDLFVLSGYAGGLPDHLFMNDGDGTFTDEAASWGLTAIHNGKGIAVADYDGDGWLDVYVTSNGNGNPANLGRHKLYHNNGDRTFSQVASAAGVDYTGTGTDREDAAAVTFGDYDLDGDLDLFVAAYDKLVGDVGNNILFRNEGDGTFSDVTPESNLFTQNESYSAFAVRFADMDGDRYPELLCLGDKVTTHYFKNNRDGTFQDVTVTSGTNQGTNEMGMALLDYDSDGLLDWFVTDIYYSVLDRLGNHLYHNLGNHVYEDVAIDAGVDDGSFAWGAVAIDFDHDRDVDLANTNGSILDPILIQDPTRLFLNEGDGTFTEVAESVGLVHLSLGRGMVNFDYDNDGDQDIAIASNLSAPLQLFRNDLSGTDINWLRVFLRGNPGAGIAPNGYQAKVKVQISGEENIRYISGSDNYVSQSELSAHFGLGPATQVDELTVFWPNGAATVMSNVAANQTLTIDAPSYPPAMLEVYNDSGNVNPFILGSTDLPTIGQDWIAEIDVNTVRFVALTGLVGVDVPLEFALPLGVLLIDVSRPFIAAATAGIDLDQVSRYSFLIPNDVTLVGAELYFQGIALGSAGGIQTLTNGLKLTAGI